MATQQVYLTQEFIDVRNFCKDVIINIHGNYTIRSQLKHGHLERVFGKAGGSFIADDIRLKTLKGSPEIIGEDFSCRENFLVSLRGGPKQVGNLYDCSKNKLLSLRGSPKIVHDFRCDANFLIDLKYAPKEVTGRFDCSNNKLTSFEGVPKVPYLDISYNPITSLEGIYSNVKQCNVIDISGCLINSGGVGLILIQDLTEIRGIPHWNPFYGPLEIIKKYFGYGKGSLLKCAEELVDAGYEKYAKV